MTAIRWPQSDDELRGGVAAQGMTNYAATHGTTRHSLRREMERRGIYTQESRVAAQSGPAAPPRGAQRPGATWDGGDKATFVTEPAPSVQDIADELRAGGFDPEEWEVDRAKLNWWDSMTSAAKPGENKRMRMYQRTLHLKRKTPLAWLFPAADVADRSYAIAEAWDPRHDPEAPQTIVLLPDPHCPFEDRELDARVESMLYGLEPDRITILGDVCDFSSISRHRDNPAWFASAQENIQAAFAWLAGKREASTGSPIDWLEGNHDARLRYELLARAERVYGLKPADIPGQESGADALSLEHLCHLDRLGITFVGPPLAGDEYHHAGLDLGPTLHARHGFVTGANSPEKTLDRIGMNVVLGHTHRQDRHTKALYRGGRLIGQATAWECGTLATVEGGLGYAVNANWHQGLAVATIYPDGPVDVELVPYLDGALRFRGRRY